MRPLRPVLASLLLTTGCAARSAPPIAPCATVDPDERVILFGIGRSEVSGADAAYELGYAVAMLEEHASMRALVIGRADGKSMQGMSLELSVKRALAVKQALVDHGVAADRVRVGVPREGGAARVSTLNRRAEIVLYDPAAGDPASRLAVDVDVAR
jgi:hypothetical protein